MTETRTLTLRITIPDDMPLYATFTAAVKEYLHFAKRREEGTEFEKRVLTSMSAKGTIDAAPVKIEWQVSE